MDDRFGFEQIEVTTMAEWLRGERAFIDGFPGAVRLIGGPQDGEVVDGGATDYAEVTYFGDIERTAIYAPERILPGPASLPVTEKG